ncbi:MAG: hypothetical protein RLZZ528_2475, partial [Pseudomonadota bacterium]
MKKVLMTASVLALGTSAAVAGGVERSAQSVGILFEEGTYAELSFGHVDPTVEGTFALSGTPSGDMASSYVTYSLGIKQSLNDNLDLAIIMDQPIGANVSYPTTAVGYPFAGSTATVT